MEIFVSFEDTGKIKMEQEEQLCILPLKYMLNIYLVSQIIPCLEEPDLFA